MNRAVLILIAALLVGGAVFSGSFFLSRRACCPTTACNADDLDWLREEFQLSDAELTKVRELHEGYRPKCAEMCRRIGDKQSELMTALTDATNFNATIETKLSELHALRAQCLGQMLKHFMDVSRAMPPEPGRRYLAEMQKLTLSFSGPCEQAMCGPTDNAHGQD
jgi:hypothetical protein